MEDLQFPVSFRSPKFLPRFEQSASGPAQRVIVERNFLAFPCAYPRTGNRYLLPPNTTLPGWRPQRTASDAGSDRYGGPTRRLMLSALTALDNRSLPIESEGSHLWVVGVGRRAEWPIPILTAPCQPRPRDEAMILLVHEPMNQTMRTTLSIARRPDTTPIGEATILAPARAQIPRRIAVGWIIGTEHELWHRDALFAYPIELAHPRSLSRLCALTSNHHRPLRSSRGAPHVTHPRPEEFRARTAQPLSGFTEASLMRGWHLAGGEDE